MEFEQDLTTEKIRKKFSSQFTLVEYLIQQAKGMILTQRRSRVFIDTDNVAANVIEECSQGKDISITEAALEVIEDFDHDHDEHIIEAPTR